MYVINGFQLHVHEHVHKINTLKQVATYMYMYVINGFQLHYMYIVHKINTSSVYSL